MIIDLNEGDATVLLVVVYVQFVDIGVVTSIEMNHKSVDSAKKGQEICVKIEPIPGESPKMYGRHFEATDIIVSKVRPAPRGRTKQRRLIGRVFSSHFQQRAV